MAVVKTMKGQTVITVVCNIVYHDSKENFRGNSSKEEEPLLSMEKMASAWRVMTFFLIVFVVPALLITLPLYARYTLYPPKTLALMPSSTIDLDTITSSFWCQGERVSTNSSLDAFLMPHAPSISAEERRTASATETLMVTEEQPQVQKLHMLKGSSCKLATCARWPGGTVIVVRGIQNFKKCYYKEERDLEEILERQALLLARKAVSDDKRKMTSEHIFRSKKTSSILPPTNADVFEEEVSNGGEDFSEDSNLPNLQSFNNATVNEKLIIKEIETSISAKSLPQAQSNVISEMLNNKVENRTTSNKKIESKVLRSTRSVIWRDDVDGSDEKRLAEEQEMRLLGLLHTVNDTRDVTAGNSSISSSEEFMEQCTTTIFHFTPMHLKDCQSQEFDRKQHRSFTVNSTDDYYIIFMSDNSLEENVFKYHLEVEMAMYNLSDYLDACSNSTECIFPLSFLSSQRVIVEMEDNTNSTADFEGIDVQVVCQPRVAVYMAFILLVPFIILMFAFQ